MARLKTCVCYYCHRGITDTIHFTCCRDCGRITCSKCPPGNKEERCGSGPPRCDPWSEINILKHINLISLAPVEELKLLDFGKWCPFRCEKCHIPILDKTQFRFNYQAGAYNSLHCTNCYQSDEGSNTILANVFGEIMLEMKTFFSNTVSKPVKPTRLELTCACTSCKRKMEFTHCGSLFNMNGETICQCCASGRFFEIDSVGRRAIDFLDYVADPKDLKLLTYSKWVDLRCSACSVHFSSEEDRLPMFHAVSMCWKMVCKKCSVGHEKSCLHKDDSWSGSLKGMFYKQTNMILLTFLVRAIVELRPYFKDRGIDSRPSTSDDELGRGGQGCVRKEAMAVKEFFCGDDAAKQRASREVEVLKKLHHPNIVKYYDSNWDEHRKMMIVKMEMCGESLRHYIGNYVSHEVQVSWCHDIFNALLYLQLQRVLHRDIKPENILTVPTGQHRGSLKLCDFGLAKFWSTGTYTQNRWCTPPYLAPEASSDPNKYCFGSDLYSAGVTLWEVVNQSHVNNFKHKPTSNDPPLLKLIYKCTAKLSERIAVQAAYNEIDAIKKRDIGGRMVNFDALLP